MDAGAAQESARDAADKVSWELRDGVAILSVDNPPVGALVQPVRAGLYAGIERADADPQVRAIVIRSEGRTFPAGADVRDFTARTAHPTLAELCLRVEACGKPVVAAIRGTALGGGFELALACHYRLALPDVRLGFPEVTLGLVPNAGGTQRLPRIAGARVALDLLTGGRPIEAARAHAAGLIDKVVQKNLDRAAFGSARNMGEAGTPPRPTQARAEGLADPARYLEVVAARRGLSGLSVAAGRAVDLVEAALLVPFEAGLDMEHAAYEDLVQSDAARGLRHAFLAERRAGRFAAPAGSAAQTVTAIGVVGAGPLARDVALAALATGVAVTVALEDDSAITRLRSRLERALAEAVEAGRLSARDRDDRLGRLVVSEAYRALAGAEVIIEALPEDAVRKAHVLSQLDGIARPGAVIASSTAACDIETLAGASRRPEHFAAMHFVTSAGRGRLAEIAPARTTAPGTVLTLLRLARAMGRGPVLSAPRQGLVFNRIVTAYYTAAALLLEQGATPGEVDGALRGFGLPEGPFQAQDRVGIDAVWGLGAGDCPSVVPLKMIDNAWYGRRSGQGFYRYDEDAPQGHAAPEVEAMIRALGAERGIAPQSLGADEIRRRCLYAMANEGARLVAAGVVARPSDVDAAMLLGLAFPREKGGPMLVADLAGPLAVRKALSGWAGEDPFWTPVPLWDDLVKYGRRFGDMDAE